MSGGDSGIGKERREKIASAPADLVTFCEAEYPRLVGMLSLYCGDADVAEDLAQEAIARACRDWKRVRSYDAPSAWLFKVGINLSHSYFRRKMAERRAKARLETLSPLDRDDGQVDLAWIMSVREAIAGLPHRQRMTLVLRYYGDLAVREVAQAMDCPEGTVKTLTYKAISNLRHNAGLGEKKGVTHGA